MYIHILCMSTMYYYVYLLWISTMYIYDVYIVDIVDIHRKLEIISRYTKPIVIEDIHSRYT